MAVQTFPKVPNDDVGVMVQTFIDAGATKVTVTPNADGKTCTVEVDS